MSGIMMPFDMISLGCSPKQFLDSWYLEGPSWVIEERGKWDMTQIIDCKTTMIMNEKLHHVWTPVKIFHSRQENSQLLDSWMLGC